MGRPPPQLIKNGQRLLSVDVIGAPRGYPVFLLHGTPGSRTGPRPRSMVLYRRGIRLISYDRPGFGDSERDEGRSVASAAADIAAIADELGLDRFAVVGRSGGGPHALAVAAIMPERISRIAVLVSLAPSDATDLDWYQGMNDQNNGEYTTAGVDAAQLRQELTEWAEKVRSNPAALLDQIRQEVTGYDKMLIGDAVLEAQLLETYREATKQGAAGWIDDVLALRRPWGFDLQNVQCPVKLWHGKNDGFSPVSHTHWIAQRLHNPLVEIAPDAGHFTAMEVLPDLISWAAGKFQPALIPVAAPTPSARFANAGPSFSRTPAGLSRDGLAPPPAAK